MGVDFAGMKAARTYEPMTISLDRKTRERLRRLAYAADTSRTAIITLALEEFFGNKRDESIAAKLRREGAVKRRK